MKEQNISEIPASTEKLSHKFILDALKNKSHAPKDEPIAEEKVEKDPKEEICGTDAKEIVSDGLQLEMIEALPLPLPNVETESATPKAPVKTFELKLPKEKKYFRIGEVSELVGVEPYVLRYWESEFKTIRPEKTKTGQRVYSRKDVEALARIRHLLHFEKFSIKGAKQKLKEAKQAVASGKAAAHIPVERRNEALKQLLSEVKELIKAAKTDPGV